MFSIVSGEELRGRAFAEGVAAGALFGIGATGMFLSICWLFAAQRIGGHTVIWVKALMVVEMLAAISGTRHSYPVLLRAGSRERWRWRSPCISSI